MKGGWDKAIGDEIAGTYIHSGTNHGRAVYKRLDPLGDQVFLYYWKGHARKNLSGWWFGSEVGVEGRLVRSLAVGTSWPPSRGWRILWSDAVDPGIIVKHYID